MKKTKEELMELAMEPPEDQDVYYCNLPYMKEYSVNWTESHPAWKKMRIMIFLSFGVSAILIWQGLQHTGTEPGWKGQFPLHLSIWVSAAIIYLVTRFIYNICKPPFKSIHNVRVQMSDDGFHYIYQIVMHLNSYFIADENIEEMIFDEEAHVLYIRGKAQQVRIRKNSAVEEELDCLYALMPYDKYDVQDILDPYGDKVKYSPGTLRGKYIREDAR